MNVSNTTIGVIAGLCVALGAGGAYLVTGGNTAAAPEAFVTSATPPVESTQAGNRAEPSLAAPSEPIASPAPAPPVSRSAAVQPRQIRSPRTAPAAAPSAPEQPNPAEPFEAPPSDVPPVETVTAPATAPLAEAEPPASQFEELVISAESVIGLQIETSTTSDRAELEDPVIAHVTRDVRVGGKVAIPAGSKAHGEVTLVERGGRLRDRARLGVRFTSIVLPDGNRVRLASEPVFREGDSPGRESATKIGGGAIGGAIIGGILGGGKGAVIGSTIGAGAGSAAVLSGGRNAATLPSGTPVTVRLTEPATVTIDRQ
jgi:hypothetical protein